MILINNVSFSYDNFTCFSVVNPDPEGGFRGYINSSNPKDNLLVINEVFCSTKFYKIISSLALIFCTGPNI